MRIRVHPEAIREARDARRWYADRDLDAADAFTHEVDTAIERLARFPKTWPLFEAGTRRILLKRFLFHIIYRENSDGVEVVALMHEKRRPGYWRLR